jgi:hypothetical protein
VPPCRWRFSPFVTNWPFSTRTGRVACASSPPTDCCGFCCRDSGRVGARACRWYSPIRSSVGTGELSPGIGQGNRGAAAREDRTWRRRFAIYSAHEPSQANPLWGAPRIHGELLKLGIAVAPSTVARYLPRPRKPPSQTWRTFLTNHLAQTAAIDFFTVPTATFRVLFVFLVLSHERRRGVHFQVTEHPRVDHAADARSVSLGPGTEMLRDRDAIYGRDFFGHDPRYGNGGSAYCAAVALAKSVRGTTRGHHPTRVPGPRCRVEPEIVTPNSAQLFCLLSAVADAFSLGQRRAGAQSCGIPATGARGSDSSGRGTTPPIPATRRLVVPQKSGFETDLWLRAQANVSAIPAVFARHGHQLL